ncbi:MAG: Chitodextrinase precursor [Bacteroidetes bacterium ADurb.Bin145]|nr:MAG: Chitodextrinase precursor [Bacteroidetes bacterium ADurb.Bin145]
MTLTLANPVVYGDAVTIAYTKPSTNPLQTAAGGQAESFPAKTVTNNLTAPVNSPPLIDISSPTKSTAFIAPATVTIEASASDPDGKVIRVEFYNGTTKLGERTSEPWSFTWKEINEGSYSITAAATDNLGARTVSSAVRIVVEKAVSAVNLAPSIAIISPINNISLEAPATVTIAVDASDPDGSIAKVEFMVGGIKFGESSVYPFSFTFQCDTAGICEIIAVAWDNLNATTTSAPVTISFSLKRELPDLAVLYPSPNNGVFTVGFNPFTDSLSEKRLTILSLSGRTVFSNEISDEETSRQIDISGVVPGIYIMHITEGNRILTAKRFIIY